MPILIPTPVLAALLTAMLIRFLLDRRLAVTGEVVSTLAASMRQNLPLPMALEWAAFGRVDKTSRILRRIAACLSQGASLGEAVRDGFRRCPGQVVAMIAAAERTAQLPAALACLEADLTEKARRRLRFGPVHPVYPLVILAFATVVVTSLLVFVMPKCADILAGFGARLPPLAQALLDAAQSLLPWLNVLLALSPIIISLWIYLLFRPRRPGRPRLTSRIGDWLKWRLPLLRGLELSRSQAQAAEMLRLSLTGGLTLDGAIANTLSLDVNQRYRRRLRRWLEQVLVGENAAAAARRCRVGLTLAWAFDQDLNGGNAPEILQTVERLHRANFEYRSNLARFIATPLLLILVAVAVGLAVYAMFIPLVAIIQQTSIGVIP
jgi:type II secretory pathway component PulF